MHKCKFYNMYLKSITVNNYRSIQKASVEFEDGLNIVIGKNGVGKSNLLKYINQNLDYRAFSRRRSNTGSNFEFEYTLCYNDNQDKIELTIYYKRERIINNNELSSIRQILLSKKVNNDYLFKNEFFDLSQVAMQKRSIEQNNKALAELEIIKKLPKEYISFEIPEDQSWLSRSARYEMNIEYNLDSDDFILPDFAILSELHDLIDFWILTEVVRNEAASSVAELDIKLIESVFFKSFVFLKEEYALDYYLSMFSPISEVRLTPNINVYYAENKVLIENLLLEFKVNNSWVPWSHLSDGTKRLFYLISQCLALKKNGLLLIEEPELGIHPHQLISLMQFLKEQSHNKQIILSTHSPIVLDILSPDELDKINIAKLTNNGAAFYKLTDEQKETAKQYMEQVGELSHYWLHSDLEDE